MSVLWSTTATNRQVSYPLCTDFIWSGKWTKEEEDDMEEKKKKKKKMEHSPKKEEDVPLRSTWDDAREQRRPLRQSNQTNEVPQTLGIYVWRPKKGEFFAFYCSLPNCSNDSFGLGDCFFFLRHSPSPPPKISPKPHHHHSYLPSSLLYVKTLNKHVENGACSMRILESGLCSVCASRYHLCSVYVRSTKHGLLWLIPSHWKSPSFSLLPPLRTRCYIYGTIIAKRPLPKPSGVPHLKACD